MSEDKEKSGEVFLSRWSRLKQEAAASPPAAQQQPAPPEIDRKAPLPELPPLDQLTIDSDFRDFFHPKVNEDIKRAALKKLFSNPHFNLMDGLDVYIDDYSKPDPLPAGMLAQLKQARKIIDWAKQEKTETAAKTDHLPDPAPALPPQDQAALPTPAVEQPPADQLPDEERQIEPQVTGTGKA